MRQRLPKDAGCKRVMINMPLDLYDFIKIASHEANLSMSAYLVKLVSNKKGELLGKKD